jgi:predicted ATP-grasp superfamily ATP-dependent carboligase
MKRDVNTGKYYMIEPNIGRPTGRSALAEASGVEILYTMYCDIFGLPLPKDVDQKYNNVKWIQIRTDLMSAFYYWKNGELTIKDWYKSIKGKKFYAVYSLKDPLPFIAEVGTAVKVIWSMMFSNSKNSKHQSEQNSSSKSNQISEDSVNKKSDEKVAL